MPVCKYHPRNDLCRQNSAQGFASHNTSTDGSHLESVGPSQNTGVSGATQGTQAGSSVGESIGQGLTGLLMVTKGN